MDSHFRNPINYSVVHDANRRLHKVELTDFVRDGQVNKFISKAEMRRILEGLNPTRPKSRVLVVYSRTAYLAFRPT